jgi:hypothetical protein
MVHGRFVQRSAPVPEAGSALKRKLSALIASGQAQGLFRDDLDPVNLYVTMTALSRFHLANAYSLSAVLGTDLRDREWRAQRLDYCVELLKAHLLKPQPAP